MTSDEFRREYHLLDRVSSGVVETYHAQADSGVMVMVHYLRGTADENAALTAALDALNPERRQRVLRTVDVDGAMAIVTRFILDFTTFEDWLEPVVGGGGVSGSARAGPATAAGIEPAVAEPNEQPAETPQTTGPSEFTALFAAAGSTQPPSAGASDSAPAAADAASVAAAGDAHPRSAPDAPPTPRNATDEAPVAPPAATAREVKLDPPGEFTRLFAVAPPPSQPNAPAPAPPSGPVHEAAITPIAPAAHPKPGEFTRLFEAASLPNESPAAADPPPTVGVEPPGPTTAASPPPAPAAHAPAAAAPGSTAPPATPPSAGPGEFTRMFGAPAVPFDRPPAPPQIEPSVPVQPPDASSGSWPEASPARSQAGPPTQGIPVPGGSTPTDSATPGEYTRLFGSPGSWPADRGPAAGAAPQTGAGASGEAARPLDRAPGPGSWKETDYLERLGGGAPPPQPPPAQPLPTPPAVPAGPSEFTRVVSAMTSAAPTAAPRPVSAPPSERAGALRTDATIIFALAAVLLAVLVFVVVFVLLDG